MDGFSCLYIFHVCVCESLLISQKCFRLSCVQYLGETHLLHLNTWWCCFKSNTLKLDPTNIIYKCYVVDAAVGTLWPIFSFSNKWEKTQNQINCEPLCSIISVLLFVSLFFMNISLINSICLRVWKLCFQQKMNGSEHLLRWTDAIIDGQSWLEVWWCVDASGLLYERVVVVGKMFGPVIFKSVTLALHPFHALQTCSISLSVRTRSGSAFLRGSRREVTTSRAWWQPAACYPELILRTN